MLMQAPELQERRAGAEAGWALGSPRPCAPAPGASPPHRGLEAHALPQTQALSRPGQDLRPRSWQAQQRPHWGESVGESGVTMPHPQGREPQVMSDALENPPQGAPGSPRTVARPEQPLPVPPFSTQP